MILFVLNLIVDIFLFFVKYTYKFHHFDYELFEQNPHKYLSLAIEFV